MPGDSGRGPFRSNRRRFLRAAGGIAFTAGLAGCPGGTGETTRTGTDGADSPADTSTASPSPASDPSPTPTAAPEPVEGTGADVPRGGTFTIGLPAQPEGLNVLTTNSAFTFAITDLVYEGGVTVDPVDFEVHPNLYTDWTIENADSGAPDVYWDVRTDAGLTWTDGEPFTVEDVLFSYNYLLDQQPGTLAGALQPIRRVERADNGWDVHMKLSEAVATWNTVQIGLVVLPEHVWSGVDDYSTYRPGEHIEDGAPVGLGPGRVTQYRPTTAVEVQFRDPEEYHLSSLPWIEEFEFLRAGGPFVDTVRYKVYSGTTPLQNALFEGEIDSRYGQLSTDAIERAKGREDITIYQGQDTGWSFSMFNVRRTPLDDVAFRQFLAMLWDEVLWVRRLNRNNVIDGDVPWPPAYSNYRPDADADAPITEHPAVEAFKFRQSSPGVPDVEGLAAFLTEGEVIDGSGGTYVGREYPGSLTGVRASQSSAKHDYSFGDVESDVLREHGANRELRVNGKTITEILGRPLEYHSYPPDLVPEMTTMDGNFVSNMRRLGVPVERKVLEFNTLLDDVVSAQEFDITHYSHGIPSPFASQFVYNLFHGDNADDLERIEEGKGESQPNGEQRSSNASGYGLPGRGGANDLIDRGRNEIADVERHRALLRQALERIYLDVPEMVQDYEKILWPVTSGFAGVVEGIPGPGSSNLRTQLLQLYENEG